MSGLLIGAVLFAAILHAGWNTIAKWIPDRLVASALIGVSFAAGGAVGALVLPMPSFEAWPVRDCVVGAAGWLHVVADQRLFARRVRPGVSAGSRAVAGTGHRQAAGETQ